MHSLFSRRPMQSLRRASLPLLLLLSLMASPARLQGEVRINELMASNTSTLPNGDAFPDWIELYNDSLAETDLGGLSLTNFGSKTFVFPANTLIPAQGFLVVFCDSAITSPGFHTLFGLKASGDGVGLVAADGLTLLDSVTYGLQISDLSIGRVPDGSGTFQLNAPTPSSPNQIKPLGTIDGLRLNEWMATNALTSENNFDWLELHNTNAAPVALGGLVLSTTPPPFLPSEGAITNLSFIDALSWVRLFCVGNKAKGSDQLDFKLSHTSGEILSLYDAERQLLLDQIIFGGGVLGTPNSSQGRLPDGGANIVIFPPGRATPAASNFLPITNAVINEVLNSPNPPLEQAIEIHNPTLQPADISHFWLSNNKDDPRKFQIPANTILAPGGYQVFYEMRGSTGGFNTSGTGLPPDFSIHSGRGDNVYLTSADSSGNLTGFRTGADFGAARPGLSFGRFRTSVGSDFVALSQHTFGADAAATVEAFRSGSGLPNAYPVVGPLVISEAMYHPPDVMADTNIVDDSLNEYIELHNITGNAVLLHEPGQPTNTWTLDDAVEFVFPESTSVPAHGQILVVNFDPVTNAVQLATFRSRYGIPVSASLPNLNLFGPYSGKLKNSGASIELRGAEALRLPPDPDAGLVPHPLIDRLSYRDSTPWPLEADGGGLSLARIAPELYGNDPLNWTSTAPSPGWQPIRIESIALAGDECIIRFHAIAGRPYTVQFTADLRADSLWETFTTFPTSSSSGILSATNSPLPVANRSFYRVISP